MKTGLRKLELSAAVAVAFLGALHSADWPLMSMRLRANDTDTKEIWKANFKAISENPGCCDEIWFSTGTGVPDEGRSALLY